MLSVGSCCYRLPVGFGVMPAAMGKRRRLWALLAALAAGPSLVVFEDYVRVRAAWRRTDAGVAALLVRGTMKSEQRIEDAVSPRTVYTVALSDGSEVRKTLVERRDFCWRWYEPRSIAMYALRTAWFLAVAGAAWACAAWLRGSSADLPRRTR